MRHAKLLLPIALLAPFCRVPAQASNTLPSSGWFGIGVENAGNAPSIITRVLPGGPAERAGLKVGDTLFAVNGKTMPSPQLRAALAATPPGTAVEFLLGTARGRFTYRVLKKADALQPVGKDSLPIRYRGEYSSVSVEVLTRDAPVVSRDSSGAMLIHVGGHVIRLRESRARR